MCLGLTGRVAAAVDPQTVLVRTADRELTVSLLAMADPVAVGDWVLVHAGFALARLTAEEAAAALRLRASGAAAPASGTSGTGGTSATSGTGGTGGQEAPG